MWRKWKIFSREYSITSFQRWLHSCRNRISTCQGLMLMIPMMTTRKVQSSLSHIALVLTKYRDIMLTCSFQLKNQVRKSFKNCLELKMSLNLQLILLANKPWFLRLTSKRLLTFWVSVQGHKNLKKLGRIRINHFKERPEGTASSWISQKPTFQYVDWRKILNRRENLQKYLAKMMKTLSFA